MKAWVEEEDGTLVISPGNLVEHEAVRQLIGQPLTVSDLYIIGVGTGNCFTVRPMQAVSRPIRISPAERTGLPDGSVQ